MKTPVVLVPYDFGPKAMAALNEAMTITKYLKGEIYLLSAIRRGDFFAQLFRNEKENRRIIRQAQTRLKDIAKKVKESSDLKAHIIVEEGNPADVIMEQAEILQAQYIVMGKMESTALNLNLLGWATLQIIGIAPCPVITVSANTVKEDGFKHIILPIDLTKQTLEKISKAISWAKYYGAEIHLIGILSGGVPSTQSRLQLKMNKAQFIIEREGVKCSADIYEKSDRPIADIILEHAKEKNGDLIMIMTHQELGVLDSYIGAVAQKILKESNIPVCSFTTKAIEHKDYFVSGFLPFELLESSNIEKLKGQDQDSL
jgi:Universal stress protein UspA and related nucleotide-binding proteins